MENDLVVNSYINSGSKGVTYLVIYRGEELVMKFVISKKENFREEENRKIISPLRKLTHVIPQILPTIIFNIFPIDCLISSISTLPFIPDQHDKRFKNINQFAYFINKNKDYCLYGIPLEKADGIFSSVDIYQPNLPTILANVSFLFELIFTIYIMHSHNITHNDIYLNVMYKKVDYEREYTFNGEKFYTKYPIMPMLIDFGNLKLSIPSETVYSYFLDIHQLKKLIYDRYIKSKRIYQPNKIIYPLYKKMEQFITKNIKTCLFELLSDETFAPLKI